MFLVNRTKNILFNKRFYSSGLKNRLLDLIPEKQQKLQILKQEYGTKQIDNVTINQTLGGMRGIKSMFWDVSLLDPEKGITFHGNTIDELRNKLPKHQNTGKEIDKDEINNQSIKSEEPMAESLLWFLLTGEIPTPVEALSLKKELNTRCNISEDVEKAISELPKEMHPMSKLSIGILLLQKDSVFAAKYREGISKKEYWEHTYEDIINLIAKVPVISALIYKTTYNSKSLPVFNESTDLVGNFCQLMGFSDEKFHDFMRLYILIHSDHEGGNASAHTCRLVGSTLSDPYLSLSASMNALAGPLHGLANQEVLKWLLELQSKLKNENKEINHQTITDFAWETLKQGKVIPGYGHAVLRTTDPRYTCQREFAQKNLPDYELFKLVDTIYEVVPQILLEHGKTKNPYPNVDSHSGILLKYYGLNEYQYYTVLFGIGRTFGVLSQLFWDRALNLPLERPKSVTIDWLNKKVNNI